jgi:glutamate-1-semialdehyde 2,1-aminomutase
MFEGIKMNAINFHLSPKDASLRERALKVVPSGMTGHLDASVLPEGYPQYFERGQGCHLWDVDGRKFIDLMCSWGPNLLGYRHPAIEQAVQQQQALGDCFNGPTPRFVELAERFVERSAHADWVMFQKNGTDATTACLTIARAATGKRKILIATNAYHGADPWCTPRPAGVTAEDRAHLIYYTFNNLQSLQQAVDQAGNDLAGIMVSGFKHDMAQKLEMPTQAFANSVRQHSSKTGAVLILDEVRTGYRLHKGGSWEPFGVRPDLCAWSKAIANGYALSAITGIDSLKDAASKIFTTGSFWSGGVAMAAALATLEVTDQIDLVSHLEMIGNHFRNGIEKQAANYGIKVNQSGPVQMPLILFEDDKDFSKGSKFCAQTLSNGAYLHPKHNMFLCLAHTMDDIDLVLEATDKAFQTLSQSTLR